MYVFIDVQVYNFCSWGMSDFLIYQSQRLTAPCNWSYLNISLVLIFVLIFFSPVVSGQFPYGMALIT